MDRAVFVEHVKGLARSGFKVFPTNNLKRPTTEGWQELATDDEEMVGPLFSEHMNGWLGVGVRTGLGFIVIDTDPKNCGEENLIKMEKNLGALPPTLTSRSGSGGHHRYYKVPENVEITNRAPINHDYPGVDVRGRGGYVVAPPSMHESGNSYEWLSVCDTMSSLPVTWVASLSVRPREITKAQPKGQKKEMSVDTLRFLAEGAADGERNHRLFKAAADMCGCGYDQSEAEYRLVDACSKCRPPYPEKEALKTIDSAFKGERIPANPEAREIVQHVPKNYSQNVFSPPVNILELGPDEPIDWILHRFIARKMSTLFTGMWKCGKTTFLAALIKAMEVGGNCIYPIPTGKALVISEEHHSTWIHRRQELELGSNCDLMCLPFKAKPDWKLWEQFCEYITKLVTEQMYDLVVFDTLGGMAPWDNESDAAQVIRCLIPTNSIKDAGAAIVFMHHPKKGETSSGQAARGSGAIPGFVDINLEFRFHSQTDENDQRRVIQCRGRPSDSNYKAVLSRENFEYKEIGSQKDIKQYDRMRIISRILSEAPPEGLSARNILNAWPEENAKERKGHRTILSDLAAGISAGWFKRVGTETDNKTILYRCTLDAELE